MNPTQDLNIVLKLRDEATKQLQTFQGVLKDNEKTFKTMRNTGAMAFGAITALAGVSVKAAADAEVAWTKFDVVFGDSADDMRRFVDDIKSDIPLSTRVIAKMTAGLGDMLVPMGFARSEAAGMSKEFVSVSAGIAAFNNVDPSEVLSAIQSGLTGNSMALRRFGVNADVARLEMLALEMGLIGAGQSFNDFDSQSRRYIQAQALVEAVTRDSADAVAGLEKEKQTLAFQMRLAGQAVEELRESIGRSLMPVVLDMFNAIKPVLEQSIKWVDENQNLTKVLIITAGAGSGLVMVLGTLGLLLPKTIALFKSITFYIGAKATALKYLHAVTMANTGSIVGLTKALWAFKVAALAAFAVVGGAAVLAAVKIKDAANNAVRALDMMNKAQADAADTQVNLIKARRKQVEEAEKTGNATMIKLAKESQELAAAIVSDKGKEIVTEIKGRMAESQAELKKDEQAWKQWGEITGNSVSEFTTTANEEIGEVSFTPTLKALDDTKEKVYDLAKGVEGLKDTYRDLEERAGDSLFDLSENHKNVLDRFNQQIDSLRKNMSSLRSGFNDAQKSDKMRLAEQMVSAQESIEKLETELAKTGSRDRRAEIEEELATKKQALEENAGLVQSLEQEMTEVRRRAGLTDIERAIEDFKQKRSLAEQEYNSKISDLRNEMRAVKEQRDEEKKLYADKVKYISMQQAELRKRHVINTSSNLMDSRDAIEQELAYYRRLAAGIDAVRGSNTLGAFNRATSKGVDNSIYNPSERNAGVMTINIGTMVGEEEYARRMGDQIMKGVGFNTSF